MNPRDLKVICIGDACKKRVSCWKHRTRREDGEQFVDHSKQASFDKDGNIECQHFAEKFSVPNL